MHYLTIPVTAFAQNCSLVWNEQTKHCALIDPGGDATKLIKAIEQRHLIPQAVWLTHGHMDHVGGARAIADHYQIPIIGPHEDDAFWLEALPIQAQRFGLPHADALKPNQWLKHGDTLKLDDYSFEVRHTPGHTPGHVVLYSTDLKTVFVGDVLFAGSIGRTDFPRGNHQQLLDSISQQLLTLEDDIEVVPGHGPNTTIGHERRTNPYLD